MKELKIFHTWFLMVLIFCSVLSAQENNEQASLAILVYCDGGSQELADKLQPLIEAEASLQWDGSLVERAKIDKLLDEMKLTRSGLSDPNTQLQFGKMITMDCLLTVRVNKDSVKATLSQFPSTTIVYEKEYTERLEPQSLSVNIVTNAIKAYREHSRDPHKPQISIGSFFNAGPFKQYFDFSKNIGVQLRQELVKDKSIVLTERLLPSDLLGEFELARAGITESIAKNLSAPSSDILLYGEFKAKPEQDLTKPAAELDFTLFVISPTGLCESKKVEFSCYSNKPEIPIEKAKMLIEQVSKEIKTKLSSGQKRLFSQKEFKEFKKQAFQLMPKPPYPDGNYANEENHIVTKGMSQSGKPEELELALNMLECALLFKGDDTQVLVCTGAILNGMATFNKKDYPISERDKFNNISLKLIERAYLIESNWNTRSAYFDIFVDRWGSSEIKPEYLEAAKLIWNTRNIEKWNTSHINEALKKLLNQETDTKQLCNYLINTVHDYDKSKEDIHLLNSLFEILNSHMFKYKDNQQTKQCILDCSTSLINEGKLFQAWLGNVLFIQYYAFKYQSQKFDEIPIEYAEHFQSILSIQKDLYKIYTDEISFLNNIQLNYFFTIYEYVIKAYNLKDNTVELKEKYIVDMIESGNSDIFYLGGIVNSLLPKLWEQHKYESGYYILTELLKNHRSLSGMEFFDIERVRFFNAMHSNITAIENILTNIEFDDNKSDSVKKIIISDNGLYGIRTSFLLSGWRIFSLRQAEKKAYVLEQIKGVYDIACTDKFIGIATVENGFYLLNFQDTKLQQFTPHNSSFPSEYISNVRSSDNNFLVSIRNGKTDLLSQTYLFDPETLKISFLDRSKSSSPLRILEKAETNGMKLTYQDINNETHIFVISDFEGNQLINYEGSELIRINDFDLWQGHLIFATNGGLYISKIYTNVIHYIRNEKNLIFYCLCPTDNKLYIGTNEGLYCIGAERFLELVKQVEQADEQ